MPQDRLGESPRPTVMEIELVAVDHAKQPDAPQRRRPPLAAVGKKVGATIGKAESIPPVNSRSSHRAGR